MLKDEEIGTVPKVPRNPSLRKRMDCCTEVKTGELPISNLEELRAIGGLRDGC